MSETLYNLGVVVSLNDLASRELGKLKDKWQDFRNAVGESNESVLKFDSGLKRLKFGGAMLGAGFALKGMLQGPIDEARAFEKELAMLKATSGSTAQEMNVLKDAALQAGLDTKFSPQQAAAGLTALASAGVQGADNIKNALIPALDLAAASAGKLSIDDASADMAASMMSFKRPAKEVADTFVNMANVASFSIQDLGAAWRGVNLQASSMNQSMATTGAVMAALKNSGATAVGSGEGVRMALEALASPSDKAKKAMAQIGISAYDSNGKFRDLIDVFADLQKATSKMSEADRNAYLDKILLSGGTKAFLAVTGQGIDTVRGFRKTLEEEGAASRFAKTNIDTYNGSSEILEGTIQTLKVLIGNGMTPALKNMKDAFISLLTPVAAFLKENPKFVEMAGYALLGLTAFMMLSGSVLLLSGAFKVMSVLMANNIVMGGVYNGIISVGTWIKNLFVAATYRDTIARWANTAATAASSAARTMNIAVLGVERTGLALSTVVYGLLTRQITFATAAKWALNSAFLASPITWIIIGVLALAAGLALLVIHWDKVSAAIERASDWFRVWAGASDDSMKARQSLRGINNELDEMNAKREKAAKYGLTGEVAKYDAEMKKLNEKKDATEKLIQQDKDYEKMKKDSQSMKGAIEKDIQSGSFGKSGSAEYEAASKKMNDLDAKSKLSKAEWLKVQEAENKALKDKAAATEDLSKKQGAVPSAPKPGQAPKRDSALDIINMNNGAVFNGGGRPAAPQQPAGMKLPDLSGIKVSENSLKNMAGTMQAGMKTAVESVPVSMKELTEKLELVLTQSGKKLGAAFASHFRKGLETLNWKDLELFLQRGFSDISARLNAQAFNSGRSVVQTYSSGLGKETGGTTFSDKMKNFGNAIVEWWNQSDAKKGPLSKTTQYGANLVKTYASGIDKGKGFIDKPLNEALTLKPNAAAQNLARNVAGEKASVNQVNQDNGKSANLTINGISIKLEGMKGIGQMLEEYIIQEAERLGVADAF